MSEEENQRADPYGEALKRIERGLPVNDPEIEPIWQVSAWTVWGGGHDLYLNEAEYAEYRKDSDSYVARDMGFEDKEEYYEWLRLSGAARCGCNTNKGRPCRNLIGFQLSPAEWRGAHDYHPCGTHRRILEAEIAKDPQAYE
jgi:hypothetical protein